jgi:hypothetical protein
MFLLILFNTDSKNILSGFKELVESGLKDKQDKNQQKVQQRQRRRRRNAAKPFAASRYRLG